MTATPIIDDDPDDFERDVVDHRLIGTRLRSPAATSVIAKSVAAGIDAGLDEEFAEILAHSAADQQQLRKALREPKIQRFGTEQFTYIQVDVLTWRIVESPDNIRFEGEHARGEVGMPRFGSIPDKAVLTFAMSSSEKLIDAMGPRITDMVTHNPHVESILDRGIETPGWLSFLRITTDLGTETLLESTDGFGRTVAAHKGIGVSFADVVWNLRPGTRRAANLHRDIAAWAASSEVTEDQARKVRCAIMPNARVIIGYEGPRAFERARRRLVAHLHLAPPMNFTIATSLNAKANAAVDSLYDSGLLPFLNGMTGERVGAILDGTDRDHRLLDDEVAVLACGALNPQQNTQRARAVNDAIADLTGVKAKLEERTQLAAEVALRPLPADSQLTGRRSALERAWRWSAFRSVELTCQEPRELLKAAVPELVQNGRGGSGPATAELAALASYHLVAGRSQLLARSEHGGRGSTTEPQTIMKRLAQTDVGLRQLCQIVLDGRAGRTPQFLPEGTRPMDRIIREAEPLTGQKLRELTKTTDGQPITHKSPDDQFAAAIETFQDTLDDLVTAAEAMENVVGDNDVALVETVGFDSTEVKDSLDDVMEKVVAWRGARRRAGRLKRETTGGQQ